MNNNTFNSFCDGSLKIPDMEKQFSDLPWSNHPSFEGVQLKHIITSKDTKGSFSFHLVRILPGKAIGDHVHETQLETHEIIAGKGVCTNGGKKISYEPGVISIFKAGISHEIHAGDEGLYLFAKFLPALC